MSSRNYDLEQFRYHNPRLSQSYRDDDIIQSRGHKHYKQMNNTQDVVSDDLGDMDFRRRVNWYDNSELSK